MDYREIKIMLLNRFIDTADEADLRYLDSYYQERIETYESMRVKIKLRLKNLVKEHIKENGYTS